VYDICSLDHGRRPKAAWAQVRPLHQINANNVLLERICFQTGSKERHRGPATQACQLGIKSQEPIPLIEAVLEMSSSSEARRCHGQHG